MKLSFKQALLLITLAWIILAFPWLSGQVTVPWDAKAHWYPHMVFLHKALQSGESFLWVPYIFAGSPEIADPQSAIFQLPMLIAAIFSDSLNAPDRAVLCTIWVGMVAILMLFKDRGEGLKGGVVAAIAFGFGAAVCWRLQHLNQVTATALLPVALLFLDRAIDRKSLKYGALAGGVSALILIGRDQVALLAVYWLFFYTLYRIFIDKNRIKLILPLLSGAVVACLLIPLPFLLTYNWAELSNRPEIDEFSAGRGSLHPVNLLTLVIGNLFGAGGDFREHWGAPSLHFKDTDLFLARNMNVLYMGILPVILLINGGFMKRNRVFLISALVFLLFALGKYTPAFHLFYKLPFIDIYRRPADAVFLVGLFTSLAAGMAWNNQLHLKRIVWVIASALTIGLWIAYVKGTVSFAYDEIMITFFVAISSVIALWTFQKQQTLAALYLVIIVLVVDLKLTNGPSESTGLPPETYDVLRPDTKNETIAYLKANLKPFERVELRGLGYHWQNASLVHGFYDILGFNPLRDGTYSEVVGTEDIASLMEQRRFTKQFTNYRSPLAAQLGLRFLVTGKPVEGLTPVKTTKDGFIYEFTPQPRVVFPGGEIVDFNYSHSDITIKVKSAKGGILTLRDVHHPWWYATVNDEEADISRVDLLFRSVEVPDGEAVIKMTFRPFKGIYDEGIPYFRKEE